MIVPNVYSDHESLSLAAAGWIIERVRWNPSLLLCAASGSTPHRTYELLAKRRESEPETLKQLRLLKLDEWGGLPMDDPSTCETHLRSTLVEPLGLQDRYVAFASDAAPQQECDRVGAWLREHGPIDLCVLGLGLNGHLGFNEPAEWLQPHAHVAELSLTSLKHAMLSQTARRPTHGLTLGMADLMQSREVLLLVSGTTKRESLARILREEISPGFPASFLHLHPRVTLMTDAASSERT
jgi:galactosamine-6-phosphate isomerase